MSDPNLACLDQLRRLVSAMTDAQYASPRGHHSAIGAHVRHVLEHYQSLAAAWQSGMIDYDARQRDPVIEGDRRRALAVIDELTAPLMAAAAAEPSTPVRVQVRCHADDPAETWTDSSLGRETQFLVSHSVHHFAVIRLLVESDDVPIDPDFGVAPSTVHARAAR